MKQFNVNFQVEMFFPPTIDEEFEPDPWSAPPVVESDDGEYLVDEDGNRYTEEFVEDEKGDAKLMKRVIRLANGTKVDLLVDYGAPVVVPAEKEAEQPRESGASSPLDEGERPSVTEDEQPATEDGGEGPPIEDEGEIQPIEDEGDKPSETITEEQPAES